MLLAYQQRWLRESEQVALCVKSRQIGISWVTACWAAMEAAHPRGDSTYYVSYRHDVGQQFIADVADWARAMAVVATTEQEIVRDPDGDYQVYKVAFASGHEVVALPGRPRALRSRRGHVVIDEAAHVDDLDALMDAALAMLIWGHSVRLVSTQLGEGAFYRLLQAAPERGWAVHKITFRDAIRDGLYRTVAAKRGHEWTAQGEREWEAYQRRNYGPRAAQELDCEVVEDGSAYLPAALIRSRMIDVPIVRDAWTADDVAQSDADRTAQITSLLQAEALLGELIPGRRRFAGWDVARDPEGDPIVGMVIEETHRGRFQAVLMLEFRGLPYGQQTDAIDWLWQSLALSGVAVDATGIGSTVGEHVAMRWPERGHAVPMTAPWYGANLPVLKDDLESGRMLIPRHDDVSTDARLIEVREGVPRVARRRAASSDGGQRHGDSIIALALARYAATCDPHLPPWTPDAVQSGRPSQLDDYAPSGEDVLDELDADPWAV